MSNVFTAAGTRYYIGDALPATYDKAGFEAVVWAEIGEVVDGGSFGKTYNLVTHNPLGDRRTVKRKGSYNDGTINLTLGRDSSDAGQALMLTAVDDDGSQPIKVVLQDGTHFYFTAQVMSYTADVGTVDTIVGSTGTLEIDNDILEEDAPASI